MVSGIAELRGSREGSAVEEVEISHMESIFLLPD